MSDFTKEELEFFVQSMGYHGWHHNGPLITKVQSMIDSYCEHVWDEYAGHLQCQKCNLKETIPE